MKNVLGISLTIAGLWALAGCGSKSGGNSGMLVSINGENISYEQMDRYLAKKPTVRVSTQSGIVEANIAEPLDFQALQDMIGQKVIMQLAKDEGVYPNSKDIEKELAFRKKLDPNYVKTLTANGIVFETIKENLALELARENLITKGITVTKPEAEDYVKQNPKEFMDPATADMLWVFVKSKSEQDRVNNELASGQSFVSIAVRFSKFAGAAEAGGRFPQREIGKMRPELQKVVNETPINKVSKWLQLSDGLALFYIEKKIPSKPITMTEERIELVRRSLARMRGEQATDLPKKVLSKIKESQINVSDPALAEQWKRAAEKLAKEGQAQVGGSESIGAN